MSAGYAFASVVARAFAQYGWPADVRGVETDRVGGGLVTDLPLEPFRTDPRPCLGAQPLEIVLTDRAGALLLDAGLMPLSAVPYSEELVFGAVRSLQVPQRYQGAERRTRRTPMRGFRRRSTRSCAPRASRII